MSNTTNSSINASAAAGLPVPEGTAADEQRFLQPLWDLRIGYEDYLTSPLFPVIVSILVYFGQCLPFMLLDLYCYNHKWYLKYKIQPDKQVRRAKLGLCGAGGDDGDGYGAGGGSCRSIKVVAVEPFRVPLAEAVVL